MNTIGLDDFILECWGIDEGWTFSLISMENWWELKAVSERLGQFKVVTPGAFNVEKELATMLETIKKTKKEYNATTN